MSNLGNALRAQFWQSKELTDLDDAITASRQAVAAAPADHPDRAGLLRNLSVGLRTRFERSEAVTDLEEAISASRHGAAANAAPPAARARAAEMWGQAAASGERWHDAAAGFEKAVSLLDRVAPRSLVRSDQEHVLEDLAGLASDAAACCIQANLADRAVELLEQGRGVLLGQALDIRTDLTDLTDQHPGLAKRFTTLRDALDDAGDQGEHPVMRPGQEGQDLNAAIAGARLKADQQRATAEAFEQVINEIRDRPGFDGFLRPLSAPGLLAAAANGPVVIINVSEFGSHALIVSSTGVLAPVPLDEVTPVRVAEQVVALLNALLDQSPPADTQAELTGVLGWLWDAIASPVLDRLGLTGPPPEGQPWPRLWWCLPGLLSFVPLHAAGHHQTRFDPVPKTVMDRVVSSYTPTIRALIHARRNRPERSSKGQGIALGEGGIAVVAMPRTPGASDLPGAETEAHLVSQRFGAGVRTLAGSEATYDAVLAALRRALWAHFACHGYADVTHPSASRLLLADHLERPMTVTDVARLRLDDAEFAFLSACSTARPGTRLVDEAIHLASAFQLAGYRHVIGTLWPINDHTAVELADDLYTAITSAGAIDDIAVMLHAATRRLRNRWLTTPSVWASHIHSGA